MSNSYELRVRFPGPTDTILTPTQLSGALLTLSVGALTASYLSLWYEKPTVGTLTGNLFVTSSNGRLQLTSASMFDDNFYNVSLVDDSSTGSLTLSVIRVLDDEVVYLTSSYALVGTTGYVSTAHDSFVELGSSTTNPSKGEFWAQEFRAWNGALRRSELLDHAYNFESYGRKSSFSNSELKIHWRLNDGSSADGSGKIYVTDSTMNNRIGTGSAFTANQSPFERFLFDYSYIPSPEYGWNQQKVRVLSGSSVSAADQYHDERLVSLEFNMMDALNEDISHMMTSYDELNNFIGLPVNRYRGTYEGLQQMRETYFKRLQGQLNFRVFADMLDFFDRSFIPLVRRLLPASAKFRGDEFVVESHMLERSKYQYHRPIRAPIADVSGAICMVDRRSEY